MKRIILIALVAITFASCSKEKCNGCTVVTHTYYGTEEIANYKSEVDCGATVGTTKKEGVDGSGKKILTITTTTCR